MCELDDLNDFARRGGVTRRRFGLMTLGAGLAAAAPGLTRAGAVEGREVDIETADGKADAYFVHPAGGPHPGVLMWPDIFGLRPAFRQMADRLAESGYAVLVVNPFYRTQRAPTAPENPDFGDAATRSALLALKATLSAGTTAVDAPAFVGFLDRQPAVDTRRPVGTLGYCMSGPIAIQTAASVPDRVAAVASFHGGGLATDQADSPHRLIPKTRASYLIAIAENDDQREPAVKDTLRAAFAQAKLDAEIEVYAGTLHGWCPPDARVYDPDQAEKAWRRLLHLFGRALRA